MSTDIIPHNSSENSTEQATCPHCSATDAYQLADGRRKCKTCKKKFSTNKNSTRLSASLLDRIADHFWTGDPAEQCAPELNINRKTAQIHYQRLRQIIFTENLSTVGTVLLKGSAETEQGRHPAFWILLCNGHIVIGFPDQHTRPDPERDSNLIAAAEVFSTSATALASRTLDKLYRRTLWAREAQAEQTLSLFWRETKQHLSRYRGGRNNQFLFFVTEMAFRFNHKEDLQGLTWLKNGLHKTSPDQHHRR